VNDYRINWHIVPPCVARAAEMPFPGGGTEVHAQKKCSPPSLAGIRLCGQNGLIGGRIKAVSTSFGHVPPYRKGDLLCKWFVRHTNFVRTGPRPSAVGGGGISRGVL
jgi:hypothetical protein